MVKPTFIGLGAQKCASSWIHQVLGDHPDVFASEPKEVDFFTNYYNRGYTWYERHFEGGGSTRARGEISPSYFCDPLAPARVREYDPRMKLVLALRDPIERAFSNHLHEIRKGFYHGRDLRFEAALAQNPMYIFQSRYGHHLENWLKSFHDGQILILLQEEIRAGPLEQARRLYTFLDVDPDHHSRFARQRSHESVGVHNRWLFRAWRAVGNFGRRHGLEGAVEAAKRFPPVAGIMAANRRDLRADIPAILPETRQVLTRELAPDLWKLAELTGRYDWPWPTWRAALSTLEEERSDGPGGPGRGPSRAQPQPAEHQ